MIEHNIDYYSRSPFIFHKFLTGITSYNNDLQYNIVKNHITIHRENWAHLHCFNINDFNNIYGNYIQRICEYFNVLITYCEGDQLPCIDSIILHCNNRGMDIGPKIICMDYFKKNNIECEHILFLHSKKCPTLRQWYFEPIIDNLQTFSEEKSKYGVFVPPLLLNGDYLKILHIYSSKSKNAEITRNKNNIHYFNEFCNLLGLNHNIVLFPEGNCYILKYSIAKTLFLNDFYYLLNTVDSFDANWVFTKYKLRSLNIDDIYNYYKSNGKFGNNIQTKMGHKGLSDAQIEHIFERLIFNVMKKLDETVYIFKKGSLNNNKITQIQNIINNDYNGCRNYFLNQETRLILENRTIQNRTIGIYIYRHYNNDVNINDYNIIFHNLNMLLQCCDDIYIYELYDNSKSQLSRYIMNAFKNHYVRFSFAYFNNIANYDSLADKELYRFIINNLKNTRRMKVSVINNFIIYNSSDVILSSLSLFKKSFDNIECHCFSFLNKLHFIKSLPANDLKDMLARNIDLKIEQLQSDTKNDLDYCKEKKIMFHYEAYNTLYNEYINNKQITTYSEIQKYISGCFNYLLVDVTETYPFLSPSYVREIMTKQHSQVATVNKVVNKPKQSEIQDKSIQNHVSVNIGNILPQKQEQSQQSDQSQQPDQPQQSNQLQQSEQSEQQKKGPVTKRPVKHHRHRRAPFKNMNYFSNSTSSKPKSKAYYSF